MENHVELIEQWRGNMEASMEQIRQLVLDQQSRPQVTVDQIRQLIQEHIEIKETTTEREALSAQNKGNRDHDTVIITITREAIFLEERDD